MDLETNYKRKRGSKFFKPGRSKVTATNKLSVAACGGIGVLLLGSAATTPVDAAATANTLAVSPVAVASPVATANPIAATKSTEAASTLDQLPDEFDLRTGVEVGHGAVRVQFNSHSAGNGYVLTVEQGALILSREIAGKSTRLATASLEGPASGADKITIKRRPGRIMVMDGPRLAMNVEDTSFMGGSAVLSATGGATATELKEQKIEELYFADDFMRQPGETGEWEYDSPNNWNIQTVGIVERGANPFSLESKPNPTAITSSGKAFWSDYAFECAAKGSADTTFGQCVDLQDNKNFYKLQWSSGPKGLLQLIRVMDGKETVLASRPGGFIPGQWYMMGLRTANGRLIAEIDHQRVLNVEDTTFGQGKIGLYSAGANGAIVWFDSVIVRPSNLVYDDFGSRDAHKWDVVGGRALGGDPTWQNYTVTAELTPSNTAVGIPIRYQDSKNYYIFTTNPTGSGLYAVVDGQKKQLDSSTTGTPAGGGHIAMVGAENGYLWGAIDGKRVVEGVDFHIPAGRTGFQPAAAAGGVVRSFTSEAMAPPEMFDNLTPEFGNVQKHPEMGGWSGPLHAWEDADFGNDKGYWHRSALYGNITVRIPLIPADIQSGQFGIVLNGDGKTAQSGYELDYNAAADGITLVLQRQGVEVAHGHLKTPADTNSDDPNAPPTTLDIYRQGRFIYAGIGKQVAIQYADPHPVDGYTLAQNLDYAPDSGGHSRLGLILRGSTAMDMPNIIVNNRHVYAETFHLAPVNWRPQSGEWTMFSRWACQPGWTWYGGKDLGYATNWHKNSMWGDQSIDYFAGAMMAAEKNAGTEAWRDLNCAFCSDGVNLFSGYTLIVDGNWTPSTSKLYRKGKVVAESSNFLFPPQGVAHRLWFDVHILKQGNTIHVLVTYLDNQGQRQEYPLMDYTDPEPLEGGFVGFWTWDNGMMLSRTVLSCQQQGRQPIYTADPTWLATEPADAPYPGDKDAGLAIHDLKPPAEAYLSMPGAPHTQPAAAIHPTPKPVHEAAAVVPTASVPVAPLGIR